MQLLQVIAGVFLTFAIWEKRGAVAGIVALVVYGLGFSFAALRYERVVAWSIKHPLIDSAFLAPFVFLACAYITDWPLGICALVGVGAWLVLLAVIRLLKRSAS